MTQAGVDRSRLLWPIPGCKAGRICDRRIRASRFRRRRRSDRWDSIRRSTATRIGQQWFWTPSPRRSTEQPETESESGRRLCVLLCNGSATRASHTVYEPEPLLTHDTQRLSRRARASHFPPFNLSLPSFFDKQTVRSTRRPETIRLPPSFIVYCASFY